MWLNRSCPKISLKSDFVLGQNRIKKLHDKNWMSFIFGFTYKVPLVIEWDTINLKNYSKLLKIGCITTFVN